MKPHVRLCISACAVTGALLILSALSEAQPPGGKKGDFKIVQEKMADFVDRMMAFDKNKDGKLTKEEVTDRRLHALFDRADANKDGIVTREELEALFAREDVKGGLDDDGPKGPPKGKGFKGGPQPGRVLPPFVQQALDLSDDQRKQIDELQKEVDARLDRILTKDQKVRLRELREKGPKGFRPPPGEK